MKKPLVIPSSIIRQIVEESRESSRKRAWYMARSASVEVPMVAFNVMQPGTYVRPHFHPERGGKEIMIPLQGKIKAVLFDS